MATVDRTYSKPTSDIHRAARRKPAAGALGPLDRTAVPPPQLLQPCRRPARITTKLTRDPDPNAFNPGRITERKDPRRFLKANTGMGGSNTTALRELAPGRDGAAPLRPPRMAGAFMPRFNPPNSELRRAYERGDLPCVVDQRGVKNRLAWRVEIDKLDLAMYLPLFFSGLRETEHPISFIAKEGVMDLLTFADPARILPVVPQLIMPLKEALETRDKEVCTLACKVLSKLAAVDQAGPGMVGRALVPYYRQLLPTLNLFSTARVNCGDEHDYGQNRGVNIGDVVMETLGVLEATGGPDAYVNIKYCIPVYQTQNL